MLILQVSHPTQNNCFIVAFSSSRRSWLKCGKWHRLSGPAFVAEYSKEWIIQKYCLNDQNYTKKEWKKAIKKC